MTQLLLATTDSPLRRARSTDPLDVIPLLLAVLIVPTGGGIPTLVGIIAAAVIAVTPTLQRSRWLWLAIGFGRLAVEFTNWHGVDNHEVLISYTCAAFGLALASSDPARTAARSLPMLVGLTMAFATAWKIGSGQFIDGDTLRYTLLSDRRFDLAAEWFGGLSPTEIELNDEALIAMRKPGQSEAATLVEPARLTRFAVAFSWGAVAIEAVLAVFYLRPRTSPRIRAELLAVFCVVTYLLVPVSRFGLVLVAGAYAGTSARFDRRVLIATAAFCIAWPPIWLALGGTALR